MFLVVDDGIFLCSPVLSNNIIARTRVTISFGPCLDGENISTHCLRTTDRWHVEWFFIFCLVCVLLVRHKVAIRRACVVIYDCAYVCIVPDGWVVL